MRCEELGVVPVRSQPGLKECPGSKLHIAGIVFQDPTGWYQTLTSLWEHSWGGQ